MAATHEDRNAQLSPGAAIKVPCRAATTGAITLSGEQTIDGVACITADRVLVKNQTNQTTNGIYLVSTGSWTREPDFDGNRDVVLGTVAKVNGGTQFGWWGVTTANPITFGSSNIAFLQDLASSSSTVSFLQSGTGAVTRTMQSKERDIVSVKDFGAVGDGVTDDTAAIQAALNIGIAVYGPAGTYKTTSTLAKPAGSSLFGVGGATIFAPVSCDFMSFTAGGDQQDAFVRDFAINGTTCTTNTALKSVGTVDRTVVVTGQHISGIKISNYQTAMNFRNFHSCSIKECWAQNINKGIMLAGQNIVVDIETNILVLNSGCGTGTTVGISIDSTSDYDPGGTTELLPEGIHITGDNLIFGFATGISAPKGTFVNILDNDIEASVTGIEYTNIGGNLNIKDNYIEVDGATATFGIRGGGRSVLIDTSLTNIEGNNVIATGAVTAVGIQLNGTTAGGTENANQTHVTISKNIISGWTVADIYMNSAGDIDIIGNRCRSAITNSILIKNALASRPITIDQNRCAGTINVPNANTPLAQMVVGANYGLFSTYIRGTSTITNGNTTVTTTYASLTPTTKDFDSEANTGMKQKLFIGAPDKNIGAVWGTASATQVVLTCATASVGSTIIPWEVRAYATGLG